MKLLLREYLASLREREELDAVLPDLLSQMGMNVISRPRRGVRQYGVDVAAVGAIDGQEERVYLFSVKPGDLGRADWNTGSPQSVRPSLDEILDVYIGTWLPVEHRHKKISICICVGGDIREEVRAQLRGYIAGHSNDQIAFEEWNGDKIASLIEAHFLREELLPKAAQSHLRKALAFIDEPDTSFKHFAILIDSALSEEISSPAKRVRTIRQLSICLWILFAWAREHGNLESPYHSAERLLLRLWTIVRDYANKKSATARTIVSTYVSVLDTYLVVGAEYFAKCLLPHATKLHGLTSQARGATSLDANLTLFELAGRAALHGLWLRWYAQGLPDGAEGRDDIFKTSSMYAAALRELVDKNPVLLLPIKDDQCIDIALVTSLLLSTDHDATARFWLSSIVDRAVFAYRLHKPYPCVLSSYQELLDHPQRNDAYRHRATAGSALYPFIAIIGAVLGDQELYEAVKRFKRDHLQHCNFQYWYPDGASEDRIYADNELHGVTLSGLEVEARPEELLERVFGECDKTPHFTELSAVKCGFMPLALMACRHYRLPVPLHLFRAHWRANLGGAGENVEQARAREDERSGDPTV